ncbi:hypothetical protein GCM10010307_41530 [Streptomyces vastus]|uniref:Cupin domain-containing protein n=1 Tax=Streptomyces vastus TaxID=285451 RepID=A0ABN3R1C2_9ACTN
MTCPSRSCVFRRARTWHRSSRGNRTNLCQCPHWGYLLKGRLKMRTKSGDEIYEAGQAFYWAPGHAPEALEDCEYIDFSPTKEFNEVIDHVKAQMG